MSSLLQRSLFGFNTESYHQTIGPSPKWVWMTLEFYAAGIFLTEFFWRTFLTDFWDAHFWWIALLVIIRPHIFAPFGDAAFSSHFDGIASLGNIFIRVKRQILTLKQKRTIKMCLSHFPSVWHGVPSHRLVSILTLWLVCSAWQH